MMEALTQKVIGRVFFFKVKTGNMGQMISPQVGGADRDGLAVQDSPHLFLLEDRRTVTATLCPPTWAGPPCV